MGVLFSVPFLKKHKLQKYLKVEGTEFTNSGEQREKFLLYHQFKCVGLPYRNLNLLYVLTALNAKYL